jgi:hypothetical protein
VTRTGDLGVASSAAWAITGSGANPANAADFVGGVLPSGIVNFAAGQASKVITVSARADTIWEPDETFTLSLSAPTGATLGTSSAQGIIRNDDPTRFAIAATDAVKAEGSAGTTPFTFTVTRTGDTSVAHSITYSAAGNGTNNAAPSDFEGSILPSSTVNFAAGQTTALITVNARGDTRIEADESFAVTIATTTPGLAITTAKAFGTILNDDAPPIQGTAVANTLTGTALGEAISGLGGNDTIIGGAGGDQLSGGAGADVFRFDSLADALGDIITDFSVSQGDRIDFRLLDANAGVAGDQAFAFIGSGAFTGTAGELRFAAGLLESDLDGNGVADFQIQLTGVASLAAGSLWL